MSGRAVRPTITYKIFEGPEGLGPKPARIKEGEAVAFGNITVAVTRWLVSLGGLSQEQAHHARAQNVNLNVRRAQVWTDLKKTRFDTYRSAMPVRQLPDRKVIVLGDDTRITIIPQSRPARTGRRN